MTLRWPVLRLKPRLMLAASVRHKLLAMALLPLVVVFPLLMIALVVWSSIGYDRLLITKVRSDLAVANGYFTQVLQEVGGGTQGVARSLALHTALHDQGPTAVNALLVSERARLGLDFIRLERVTPEHTGDSRLPMWHDSLPAPSPHSPSRTPSARLVLLDFAQMNTLAPHLLPRLHIAVVDTRNAAPSERQVEDRALVMLASYPVIGPQGQTVGVLHGGVLLNQNIALVDHINRIVYPKDSLPFGSQGTATLFLEDVRITTNVRLFQDQRAIGTRVSQSVRDAVLGQGHTWLDRAFVVNDWYVSAYEPLLNDAGQRIGMLYVGYLEQPFRWLRWGLLGAMTLLFLGAMALAAVLSLRWAHSIFKPVEQMNLAMQRVEDGHHDARVGPVHAQDELGALANHLDALLNVVQTNTQRLEQWAQTLDHKVQERTQALEHTNDQLQQAQQQLVKSEKLAAIGQLTASIAHEINNPIAVMQGNLDLMRELLGTHGHGVSSEFKLLDEQIERMRLIVTQLLQYARPTEFAGYVQTLDVNHIVRDSLVLVNHLLQQQQLHVEQDLQARVCVGMNRQELQQVVINLMINAIQAMPEGGVLRLHTRDWLDADGAPCGAFIDVHDSGPGLTAQARQHLFTPFYTTKKEGNGLGLWISRGLMERYGGQLEALDALDEPHTRSGGARFRVSVLTEPQAPGDGQAPKPPLLGAD